MSEHLNTGSCSVAPGATCIFDLLTWNPSSPSAVSSLQVLVLQPPHRLRSAGHGSAGQTETSPPQRPAEEPPPGAGPAPPGGYRQQLQPEGENHMRTKNNYNIIFPSACIKDEEVNHIKRTFLPSGYKSTMVMMLKYCFIWIRWRKTGPDCWRPVLYLMRCFPTRLRLYKERLPGLKPSVGRWWRTYI